MASFFSWLHDSAIDSACTLYQLLVIVQSVRHAVVARVSQTADGSAYSVEFTSKPKSVSIGVRFASRTLHLHTITELNTPEQTWIFLRSQPRSHRYVQWIIGAAVFYPSTEWNVLVSGGFLLPRINHWNVVARMGTNVEKANIHTNFGGGHHRSCSILDEQHISLSLLLFWIHLLL